MKNNATAESKEYNRLFVVSVQSRFQWPIQVPSFWNNVNFSVHCSAFVDLVPLVEVYLFCLASTVMGGRHRSLLPCTVGWQVWVWWKPNCNVHCIFFFNSAISFLCTLLIQQNVFCISELQLKLLKRNFFFPLKITAQSGYFTMPLAQRGMIWKLQVHLINFYEKKYFSLLVKERRKLVE